MKLLFSIFSITAIAQAVTLPMGGNGKPANHALEAFDNDMDAEIHRMLRMGGGCKDDFVCPLHSVRRRGRDCYDSFADCECNPGYRKSGDGCVAKRQGLCTEEYADRVMEQTKQVDFWVDMVYAAKNEDERYGYYQQMEVVLSEAWDDYNLGKASCEEEFGDDFLEGGSDGRMLLRDPRQLFFKKIGQAFKKVGQAIANVAKEVVKAVVNTIETVVEVVTEIVECGVGIVTDGLKCGLIGCAFGLVGVALDIAFTVATGGINKAAEAACDLSGALSEGDDNGDSDSDKDKNEEKASILGPVLNGIGDAVCTINDKLNDKVLADVCAVKEAAEGLTSGLALVDLIVQNEIVFRFLEAFREAMCGSPGSAVLDLLEEVVSCSIGCAKGDNVFCPRADDNDNNENNDKDEEEDGEDEIVPPTPEETEYIEYKGKACRTQDGDKGSDGKEFDLFFKKSEAECEALCTNSKSCKGWEYGRSSKRCERWNVKPQRFAPISSLDCHVKLD